VTNAELIEALRVFWPDDGQEAVAFLGALRECAEAITYDAGLGMMPDDWTRFAAVAEALDDTPPEAGQVNQRVTFIAPRDNKSRLLDAAEHGGLTIDSAARLLGVSRWQARRHLDELRAAGSLRVLRMGRASRWVVSR
jgi:Fic family protein